MSSSGPDLAGEDAKLHDNTKHIDEVSTRLCADACSRSRDATPARPRRSHVDACARPGLCVRKCVNDAGKMFYIQKYVLYEIFYFAFLEHGCF